MNKVPGWFWNWLNVSGSEEYMEKNGDTIMKNKKLVKYYKGKYKLNTTPSFFLSLDHYQNWLILCTIHQNVVTRPIPSSSASSSPTGRSVNTTRKIAVTTAAFLHVPTSVTSFKHAFSGALYTYIIEKNHEKGFYIQGHYSLIWHKWFCKKTIQINSWKIMYDFIFIYDKKILNSKNWILLF